jgi:hypothetical protein
MTPPVYNLPSIADMIHDTLYVLSGTAAAWNVAAVRDQNIWEHQNYVLCSLLEINLCIQQPDLFRSKETAGPSHWFSGNSTFKSDEGNL